MVISVPVMVAISLVLSPLQAYISPVATVIVLPGF